MHGLRAFQGYRRPFAIPAAPTANLYIYMCVRSEHARGSGLGAGGCR
jgi:hypothetical protein